jgi:hypothetical protein
MNFFPILYNFIFLVLHSHRNFTFSIASSFLPLEQDVTMNLSVSAFVTILIQKNKAIYEEAIKGTPTLDPAHISSTF